MYTIPLKDDSKEIDLVVIRSLLALAGITAFFYRTGSYVFINIIISIILLLSAFTVTWLVSIIRLKKIVLLTAAAILLFAATHAVTFSLLLILFGMLSSFIYKKPFVFFIEEGVTIKSSKGNAAYDWDEFDNVVLKDALLTLDYKSNKLLHLEVDENSAESLNEKAFNDFCLEQLEKNKRQKITNV